ncbi:MAG: hypothetical protein NUV74_04925 [Candidatus Brocadiaceae bacterium]|nr:hypothetical protein [Candidatus Brocadiaceae bacterium]
MVTILSVVSPEVIKAVDTDTPEDGIDTISGQFYEEKSRRFRSQPLLLFFPFKIAGII